MPIIHTQRGVTILEILLVLAIGATIITISLRVYESRSLKMNLALLRSQVDQAFLAMADYYRANCAEGKALDPGAGTLSIKPITFATELNGFLDVPDITNPLPNPLLDLTFGEKGYKLQLNPSTDTGINVRSCIVIEPGKPCKEAEGTLNTATLPDTQAQIVMWRAQATVALNNATLEKTRAYASILGAQCTASYTTITAIPCTDATVLPGYLVWVRAATQFSPSSSPLWQTTHRVKAFKRQYTHDQMYELAPNTTENSSTQKMRNYLCGS